MKLEIKRDEKKPEKVEKVEKPEKPEKPEKNTEVETLKSEIEKLKEQNKIIVERMIKMANLEKTIGSEVTEILKSVEKFDDFIREVGKRFAEFSDFFENSNKGDKKSIDSLNYSKIALLLHKYDLAKKGKTK